MKDPNPFFHKIFSSLMFGDCFGCLVVFGITSVILMSWWWVPITFALWIFLLFFAEVGSELMCWWAERPSKTQNDCPESTLPFAIEEPMASGEAESKIKNDRIDEDRPNV